MHVLSTDAKLLAHHLAELRASGLSDETIAAAGIHSVESADKIAAMLNRQRWSRKCGPALVFPYRDRLGDVVLRRIKPDRPPVDGAGKTRGKYFSATGAGNRAYFSPGVAETLDDASVALVLTEGEKKALALTQAGFNAVGLAGVENWHDRKSLSLIPDLQSVAWQGRNVFVAFDSDAAQNPAVADAEALLAEALLKRGAVVKVVRIPSTPDGAKQGADDFLVANGAAAFRQLVDAAEDPSPPTVGATKSHARELDAAPEAERILQSMHRDGASTLLFHRGGFWRWVGGRYVPTPDSEIKSRVLKSLNQSFFKLRSGNASDVVDQLRAQSLLASVVEPPTWLNNPPVDAAGEPWNPAETLACKRSIVHLPSLVANQPCQLSATPRLFNTAALPFEFDAQAPRPNAWLEFLAQLWPNDPESIESLRLWFGYCLTPDTSQQKIGCIIGPRRAGKGTIARVLTALVGRENVAGPTLASFGTNFGLAPLLGKSLAIISDARMSGRSDQAAIVERLLSISGEDAQTVDRKHQEAWTGKLNARIMILSNELPRLGDSSGALSGRMILWQLNESFYGRENPTLTAKLTAELPSILLWAITGWQRLRERGRLLVPQASAELFGELEDLSSPVGAFVREKCVVGPECECQRSTLYEAYADWCKECGRHYPEDRAGFGRSLRAVLPAVRDFQHRINGSPERRYRGVGLRGY